MIKLLLKTIKAKIILFTVLFTLIITILMASICFYLFQYFLERNLIQSTKFSLQLVMDSITTDINELAYLARWCGSNTTISNYLETTVDNPKPLSLDAYERLKEEYQNSKISEYIVRIMVSNNNGRFIQIIRNAYEPYISDPKIIEKMDFFDSLLLNKTIKWIGIIEEPLAKKSTKQVIPVIRPVYSNYNSSLIGWTYITASSKIILDHFKNYIIPVDSDLYITIDEYTYNIKDGTLTEVTLQSTQNKRTMVTYSSSIEGWSISQSLSEKQFSEQKLLYYLLLFVTCFIIIILGAFLTIYINHLINVPINKIRHKIRQISSGDFSRDQTIEWDNELGEIGKGINTLSLDMVTLMNKRVSDETQKNELEYQILLSQINPHFLYNTLNSIKWMATIQNATGIEEMVTALARLLKNVSKGTKPLSTVQEELSLLKDYFLIQEYRYGGNISIEYDIETVDLFDCQILKFSLQPLVENAIFHGIEPKGEAGLIRVSIRHQGQNDIIIDISDDGIGMTSEQILKTLSDTVDDSSSFFKKVGIANVHRRIQYTYGNKYGLSITSELGKYTTMSILIPYIIDAESTKI